MANNSIDAAKALIRVLNNEAYIFGEACLLGIHNKFHKDRLPIKMINIATNTSIDELKRIFPKHANDNNNAIIINFANNYYRLIQYHKVINYNKGIYLNVPYVEELHTIEDFANAQNFSIETFYTQNDFLENIYENNDPRIDDIRNKIIRIIGNGEQRIKENPNIILNAFLYMSQLGYQFDAMTMELIRTNVSLIKHIPLDYIGKVLYKILSYKHSYKALSVMQEFGIFNVCFDDIPLSKCLNDSDLECLRVFEGNTNMQNEIVSEIFDSNSINELNRLEIFDEESLNQIKWLINHKDIYKDRDDFEWRQVICDSISEGMDIHYIKDLILKNNKRQYLLHHDDNTKQQCEQLFFNLCARPYFIEQLDISDEDILKIDSNANIMAIKKSLLNKLIFSKKYPDKKEINNMLIQCIKEGIA